MDSHEPEHQSAPSGDVERRFQTLVESIPGIAAYMDMVRPEDPGHSEPVYISPQIEDLLGYPREAWLNEDELWLKVLHPQDAARMTAADEGARAELTSLFAEYRMIHRHGHVVWVSEKASVVEDPATGKLYWLGVMVDITDRKRAEDDLLHRTLHDELTGLPNRRLFLDRLAQARARRREPGRGVAVIFMDMDGFKLVNDSLGHHVGDALLVSVGQRLQSAVRQSDTVARFSGDEFLVLLDDVASEDAARSLADELAEALRAPHRVGGRAVTVTASLGVVFAEGAAESDGDVLGLADAAMYRAKQLGRDRVESQAADARRDAA